LAARLLVLKLFNITTEYYIRQQPGPMRSLLGLLGLRRTARYDVPICAYIDCTSHIHVPSTGFLLFITAAISKAEDALGN